MTFSGPVETRVAAQSMEGSQQADGSTALDKSDQRVRRMFASIARRYDFLNHLLSLNVDRHWRSFTARVVAPEPGLPVLDCCTGTADLALAFDRAAAGQSRIVATDFCREMLVLGHAKVRKARADDRITLLAGDSQRLPLANDTFGVVSVAFGLRNVRNTVQRRRRDDPGRPARWHGRNPGVLRPGEAGFWAASIRRFSVIYFLGSARLSLQIKTGLTTTFPEASWNLPDGQAMLGLLAAREGPS